MEFLAKCQRCGAMRPMNVIAPCPTVMKNGAICGSILPTPYLSGSQAYQRKCEKHSDPTGSGAFTEITSYVNTLPDYMRNQESALLSGVLYFHTEKNYLALVAPVTSRDPQAVVHFPRSGTVEPATHMVMPCDSTVPNLHHRYVAGLSGYIPVADAAGLILEFPGAKGEPYWVWSGGLANENLICGFDPKGQSGQQFVHNS